jgi:hypothetical protein
MIVTWRQGNQARSGPAHIAEPDNVGIVVSGGRRRGASKVRPIRAEDLLI